MRQMGSGLQSLENLYMLLTVNLSALTAAFPSDPQKSQFMSLYVTARSQYWTSIGKIIHDDDPQVLGLVKQMNTQQTKLAAEVKSLANVATVLNDLTTAVQIGAKIASLALAA
jgi:hypothetical protein